MLKNACFMISPARITTCLGLILLLALPGTAPATGQETNAPLTSAAAMDHFQKALDFRSKQQWDKALVEANTALKEDPANARLLVVRGDLYVKKKLWKEATEDFSAAAKLKPDDAIPAYDLAEVAFMQKDYKNARVIFLVLLKDKQLGEFAKYKVFLCDLLGESLDGAEEELAEFNRLGGGASYYYANATWELYHHRPEEARKWLDSAARIYSREKNEIYRSTLFELGFLKAPEK